MDIRELDARELIDAAGGQAALASKMGYDARTGRTRVHMWLQNGIPQHVLVSHGKLCMKLVRKHRAEMRGTQS
jgi:hypothetical protein